MKFLHRVKRIFFYSIAFIIILLIVGTVWQWSAEKNDNATFLPPGKMISVGSHQLHIVIKGTGKPVVVLEAASDGSSANWEWVINEIAKTTTVCAYDRAGHGWSEAADGTRDAIHIADEVHILLSKANLAASYILVGHSAGGLFVRAYQQQYPDEVAGMVLVDADNEKETTSLPGFVEQLNSDKQFAKNMSAFSYAGIARLIFSLKTPAPTLPALQGKQIQSSWSSSKHWKGLAQELDARLQTNAEVAAKRKPLTIPLEIISAGRQPAAWLALQNDLATLSAISRHTVVQDADHLSLVLQKENAKETSAAIMRVIDAIRLDTKQSD